VTLGLAVSALFPLTQATFLPLGDMPDTASCAALVPQILWGHGLPAEMYFVRWGMYPTWTPLVIIAALSSVTNVLVAVKIFAAAVVLLLPLATMRLLIACKRDPRLGVLAFALSYQLNFYAGWFGFLLGMIMAMWGIAWVIEATTVRQALRAGLLSGILGLTHAQAALYFVIALLALTFVRAGDKPLRRAALHALAGSGLMVLFLPWVFAVSDGKGGGEAILSSLFSADDPLHERLRDFWKFTFDVFTSPNDVRAAAWTMVMLLVTPLLATLLPARGGASKAEPAVLFLVIGLLYVSMPMTLSGPVDQWYVYPRFGAFVLLGALLLPRPDFAGPRFAWLAPAVLMIVALHFNTAAQFRDWDKRSRPFLQIISAVRKGSKVLPLEMIDEDPAISPHPFNQFHAYVAAMRSSYSPHLWRNPAYPFQYRPEKDLPHTDSIGGGDQFDLETFGPHYDYLLIQGKAKDPVLRQPTSKSFRTQVVAETDFFRLYEIRPQTDPPS
jgi:hypothetical protein